MDMSSGFVAIIEVTIIVGVVILFYYFEDSSHIWIRTYWLTVAISTPCFVPALLQEESRDRNLIL